jgi:hypothetical protein
MALDGPMKALATHASTIMITTGRFTTSCPTATARRGVRVGSGAMADLSISSHRRSWRYQDDCTQNHRYKRNGDILRQLMRGDAYFLAAARPSSSETKTAFLTHRQPNGGSLPSGGNAVSILGA